MSNLPGIRGLILDLDGVVYRGDDVIEGAAAALAALRGRGVPYVFATNHTISSASLIAARLTAMGIPTESQQVVTAATALIEMLGARTAGAAVRVDLFGAGGIADELAGAGVVLTSDRPDYVVVGWDPGFDYAALHRACGAIRGGATLVVTSPDRYIPSADGWEVGMGTLGAAVQYATGADANYVGKPHRPMIDTALRRLDRDRSDVAIVGDTLETDMAARTVSGLGASVLVLTGNTGAVEAAGADHDVAPTAVIGSLADLPGLLG